METWLTKPFLILGFFMSLFVDYCLQYDAIHNLSVWLRTGYNPMDSNWFQSLTRKNVFWPFEYRKLLVISV